MIKKTDIKNFLDSNPTINTKKPIQNIPSEYLDIKKSILNNPNAPLDTTHPQSKNKR